MGKNKSTLGELKANPKNPRRISDQKLDMLKKALLEFGDLSGIVFNVKSGQLVGGTQRAKVLPPDSKIVIRKTYTKPTKTGTIAEGHVEIDGEQFSYREVDWSKDKEKAANIAANKGAGEWEFSQLNEWISELEQSNFDLSLTMFDEDEIERLFGGWETGSELVDKTKETTDGIQAVIKVKCPPEIKDEVLMIVKRAFIETSLEGVEVV